MSVTFLRSFILFSIVVGLSKAVIVLEKTKFLQSSSVVDHQMGSKVQFCTVGEFISTLLLQSVLSGVMGLSLFGSARDALLAVERCIMLMLVTTESVTKFDEWPDTMTRRDLCSTGFYDFVLQRYLEAQAYKKTTDFS